MNENINWDHFPYPYNQELPHYIGLAYQRLTPEGVVILDEIMEVVYNHPRMNPDAPPDHVGEAKTQQRREEWEAGLAERLQALPEWDFTALMAISRRLGEAFNASMERLQGEADLFEHLLGLHHRARTQDPDLAPDATFGEAFAVLQAHGEQLGISEEVMEMAFEVPSPRPDVDED